MLRIRQLEGLQSRRRIDFPALMRRWRQAHAPSRKYKRRGRRIATVTFRSRRPAARFLARKRHTTNAISSSSRTGSSSLRCPQAPPAWRRTYRDRCSSTQVSILIHSARCVVFSYRKAGAVVRLDFNGSRLPAAWGRQPSLPGCSDISEQTVEDGHSSHFLAPQARSPTLASPLASYCLYKIVSSLLADTSRVMSY